MDRKWTGKGQEIDRNMTNNDRTVKENVGKGGKGWEGMGRDGKRSGKDRKGQGQGQGKDEIKQERHKEMNKGVLLKSNCRGALVQKP